MNWNTRVRQIHRWLAIAFTMTVIASFVALAQEEPAVWVSYLPLLPLALLLLSGLNCSCCRTPVGGAAGDVPQPRNDEAMPARDAVKTFVTSAASRQSSPTSTVWPLAALRATASVNSM